MQCSGCGKRIPFAGSVCPYCQRDKTKDQAYTVLAIALGGAGAWLGGSVWGFWGGVSGVVLGAVIAAVVTGAGKKTAPPQVEPVSADVETRLRRLDDLRAKGLVTDDEHAAKRREILSGV